MSNYGPVTPIPTFNASHHPLSCKQFEWIDKSSSTLQTALYAGKEMTICINDDDQTFQLTYLDMADPRKFRNMEEAKSQASNFARAVLQHMTSIIDTAPERFYEIFPAADMPISSKTPGLK